jgi:hypothetical protein
MLKDSVALKLFRIDDKGGSGYRWIRQNGIAVVSSEIAQP